MACEKLFFFLNSFIGKRSKYNWCREQYKVDLLNHENNNSLFPSNPPPKSTKASHSLTMPKSSRAVCDKCAVVITAGGWQKLSDYRLTQNPTESSHVTSYLMCTEELICTHTRLHTEVQTKLPATLFCCTHGWDDLLSWFAFAHMHTQKQAWKIKHMRYRSEHGCAQSIYRTPPPTQITQVSFIVSWW